MIIGITGGIGSGKSRVARFWATSFALPLIDLDTICRQLLEKGKPGWQALQDRFGDYFFMQDGCLDRIQLRRELFADEALRGEIDALLHPLAQEKMKLQCASKRDALHLVEIPLLYEAGWQRDVSRVVVVVASEHVRSLRVIERDGVSEQESMQAVAAQAPLFKKALAADHVVENNGSWAGTMLQVLHLGRLYAASMNEMIIEASSMSLT